MTRLTFLVVSSLTVCLSATAILAADWPSFRGPHSTGVGENADLPAKWSKDHFLWKVKLPGPGAATPIIVGDKVFATCYTGYGTDVNVAKNNGFGDKFGKDFKGFEQFGKDFKGFEQFGKAGKGGFGGGAGNAAEQKNLRLLLVCFEAQTGKQLWQQSIEPKLPEAAFNTFVRDHGYATSTPVTDGEHVYVFFGKTGVLGFDLTGNKLWQTDVGSTVHLYGTGSSLVLHHNLVIVNAGIESNSLIALDKTTGKEVWRVKGIPANWTTPIIVPTKDKEDELVLALTGNVRGFDPATGKELWRYGNVDWGKAAGGAMSYSVVFATPVAKDGVVFVCDSGGPGQQMKTLAIRAGGRGDVTKTHRVWEQKAGAQFNSPVVSGDYLYCVNGIVVCMRTDTGKIVYKDRLTDPLEYPSPVIAGDKIFVPRRLDGVDVLATGGKFERLAHNVFEGDSSIINASPAVSNGRLFIRTNANLYCIGKKAVP